MRVLTQSRTVNPLSRRVSAPSPKRMGESQGCEGAGARHPPGVGGRGPDSVRSLDRTGLRRPIQDDVPGCAPLTPPGGSAVHIRRRTSDLKHGYTAPPGRDGVGVVPQPGGQQEPPGRSAGAAGTGSGSPSSLVRLRPPPGRPARPLDTETPASGAAPTRPAWSSGAGTRSGNRRRPPRPR